MTPKSKLTKAQAQDQIERLAHFYGAPKTNGGWLDAIDALVRYCRDLDHCKSIIDDYVDSPRMDHEGNPKFPTLYDLRQMCEGRKQRGPTCTICNGLGFVDDKPKHWRTTRYEHVKRCGCDTQIPHQSDPPVSDLTDSELFVRGHAEQPAMIEKWKAMRTAKVNSVGYPLSDGQRKYAVSIIRQVEDYLGQSV